MRFWMFWSSRTPLAQRSTRARCSAMVKARPSPVPWSSTSPPEPVMTQFSSVGEQLFDRQGQGHIAAGDAGGACASVPLQYVAVDGDGALPQLGHIHAGAEGAADEPLDLGGAGGELQLAHIPAAPLPVGPGEHGVLRRHPAGALGDVAGGPLLHAGSAENVGAAAADEAGALGEFVDVGKDLHGAELVIFPLVHTGHGDYLDSVGMMGVTWEPPLWEEKEQYRYYQ